MLYLRSYVDQLFSHNNFEIVLFCHFHMCGLGLMVEALRALAKWATKPCFMSYLLSLSYVQAPF